MDIPLLGHDKYLEKHIIKEQHQPREQQVRNTSPQAYDPHHTVYPEKKDQAQRQKDQPLFISRQIAVVHEAPSFPSALSRI